MGGLESSTPRYGRSKPVTKQDMRRLAKGGRKADRIKKEKERLHREEVRKAEETLYEDLKKI